MLAGEDVPGWYGKLPSLGDFASRRLPENMLHGLDEWLQRVMSHSHEHFAADWLDTYLQAPVWRFVLGEGTLDALVWAGILLPSVDRVGRYFPLVLCGALPTLDVSTPVLERLDAWMSALEEAARTALDPAAGVAEFEARLGNCLIPEISPIQPSLLGQALARGETFVTLEGESGKAFPGALGDVAASAARVLFASNSLWWCNTPQGSAGGFACRGLPSGAVFARMLQYPSADG